MPCGPSTLAGKNLSADAPIRSANRASVGVKTPGIVTRPSSLACPMTSSSMFGLTINRPPALATLRTSAAESTVPAPTSADAGKTEAMRSIDVNGSGELSGTSTASIPASSTICAIAAASLGCMPRRMATRPRLRAGHLCRFMPAPHAGAANAFAQPQRGRRAQLHPRRRFSAYGQPLSSLRHKAPEACRRRPE